MEAGVVQVIFRHLTGSRATHVDVVPLGAHRELILGRARSAAVRFAPRLDDAVGRYHARIEPDAEPGRFLVTDLGSRNGTLLNGRLVVEPTALSLGRHPATRRGRPAARVPDRVRAGSHGRGVSGGARFPN